MSIVLYMDLHQHTEWLKATHSDSDMFDSNVYKRINLLQNAIYYEYL